jgi:alkylation response protein AidB-like acyl-CoA dehydrogenase
VTDVVARPDPAGGHRISGIHAFVPDGHSADLLIVAARMPDGAPGLFTVHGDAAGVTRRSLSTLDRTRRLGEIRLREVHVAEQDRLAGRTDAAALERVLELAAIALAAEQLGGAERCLELAVDYAKTRVQFGRPIGSFQAIKHKCADLFVQVESARSAVYWAGWAASVDAPDLPLAAATAKAWCSDAFYTCAAESLQIHGGIAFTWEHDAHLFLRRARAAQTLLGDAAYHRERLAQRVLDGIGARSEGPDGPAIH